MLAHNGTPRANLSREVGRARGSWRRHVGGGGEMYGGRRRARCPAQPFPGRPAPPHPSYPSATTIHTEDLRNPPLFPTQIRPKQSARPATESLAKSVLKPFNPHAIN
ncbi:unnamed protein product, partial [Iphiclides podalirius]